MDTTLGFLPKSNMSSNSLFNSCEDIVHKMYLLFVPFFGQQAGVKSSLLYNITLNFGSFSCKTNECLLLIPLHPSQLTIK